MLGRTHFAAGAAVGALTGLLTGAPETGALLGGFAGLLPDIDHPGSLMGRKIPLLSIPIKLLYGHRTITHTVMFCIVVSVISGCLAGLWFKQIPLLYAGFHVWGVINA